MQSDRVADSPQAGMDLLNLLMKKVEFETPNEVVETVKTIKKRPQEPAMFSKKEPMDKTPSPITTQRPSKSGIAQQVEIAPLQQKSFPDTPSADNISQKLDVLMEKLHSMESRMQENNPVSKSLFLMCAKHSPVCISFKRQNHSPPYCPRPWTRPFVNLSNRTCFPSKI
jgi:hypothetical protein